jgi:hypothetical protein
MVNAVVLTKIEFDLGVIKGNNNDQEMGIRSMKLIWFDVIDIGTRIDRL